MYVFNVACNRFPPDVDGTPCTPNSRNAALAGMTHLVSPQSKMRALRRGAGDVLPLRVRYPVGFGRSVPQDDVVDACPVQRRVTREGVHLRLQRVLQRPPFVLLRPLQRHHATLTAFHLLLHPTLEPQQHRVVQQEEAVDLVVRGLVVVGDDLKVKVGDGQRPMFLECAP